MNIARKVIYFELHFSANIKSRTREQILKLVDQCFPPSHQLHKMFNRSTVKVSYRTTPNKSQIIAIHIKITLGNKQTPRKDDLCKCTAEPCSVEGNCTERGTIHQATVKHTDLATDKQVVSNYVGMSD